MGNLSRGKYAYMISDRSGQRFPYQEMVQEWNGSWVHTSEYEAKQPQLDPKPAVADPQGLQYAHPDRVEPPVIIELTPDPFITTKYAGRGPPEVLVAGTPTRETSFEDVPSFDNVTDISNANGFSIVVGKINSSGIVGDTLNYFYFLSTSTATNGNVSGGGAQCSAGPVTLKA